MNLVLVGRVVRTLCRNRRLRQADLANLAVCSQQVISTIENGGRVSLPTLERVVHALNAEVDLSIRWQGGQLERLLDEGHAHLVARAADLLERLGWVARLEVTYETARSYGSIDILAFEPGSASLLVIEVKTELLAAEATLRKHDEKVRVGAGVGLARFGWQAGSTSALLVVPRSTSAWRALERGSALFGRAYPARGLTVTRWLRRPGGTLRGAWAVSHTAPAGARTELTSRRPDPVVACKRG